MSREAMKVLLVEDEVISRDLFAGYIAAHPDLDLAGIAKDGGEALSLLQSNSFDLLFMDIDLPVLSGIQVLENLKEFPYLIFITASGSHALQAFEMGAVDYLHKPVGRERFEKAVARALNHFRRDRVEENRPGRSGGLVVSENGNHYLIPYREIVYLSAHDRHTVVHTLGRDYETNRLLGDIEKILPSERFLRIHRQHIIHLAYVSHTSYLIGGRYQVYLKDPDETDLTVSRNCVPAFKKVMGMT